MTPQNTSLIRKFIIFLVVAMLSVPAIALDFDQVQRLANQGDASAQAVLGTMYYQGNGVRQDYAVAKEWFGKSCDNGDQDGCDGYRMLNQR